MLELIKILNNLEDSDAAYRFEYDDSGYHLSIIDRKSYPRVWVDNSNDEHYQIIAESPENFLQRELPSLEKDWYKRFSADTIDELIKSYNY